MQRGVDRRCRSRGGVRGGRDLRRQLDQGLVCHPPRPDAGTIDFIEQLGSLDGKQVAVFTTCAIAVGKTLAKMARALQARGANVTGRFQSKGPSAAPDLATWLRSLDT